jgi:hypothetical protein
MYWMVLCVNLTQAGVITEKGASVGGSTSTRFICGVFSQLVIKGERPLVGATISGLCQVDTKLASTGTQVKECFAEVGTGQRMFFYSRLMKGHMMKDYS